MKRAGFTMIELIFVIVILGILSAVAIPKMMGVSDKADAWVCKSYYATLNATVSPTLWSEVAMNEANITLAYSENNMTTQIDTPTGDKCGTTAQISTGAIDGTAYTVSLNEKNYDVNVTKASKSTPASWAWKKQ